MSLVSFASAKAAPGTTTTALAVGLAYGWSEQPVALVELDAAGGDLAARLGLEREPGLVTVAATARRGLDARALLANGQVMAGLPVLAAPSGADYAGPAVALVAPALISMSRDDTIDVIADCGRVLAAPADLLVASDLVVIVLRPTLAEARHARAAVEALVATGCRVGVVTVGDAPYAPAEVAEVCGVELLGAVPMEPAIAARIDAGDLVSGAVRRSRLLHSAQTIAAELRLIVRADAGTAAVHETVAVAP